MTTYRNLSTRPRRRQSYIDWLTSWADTLNEGVLFKAGQLTGETVDFLTDYGTPYEIGRDAIYTGSLDGDSLVQWHHDLPRIDFVIYSYLTPIAWSYIDDDGERYWRLTSDKYSRTTSHHQSIVYNAVSMASGRRHITTS